MKPRQTLQVCGVVYIIFGVVGLGLFFLPATRPNHWAGYVLLGVMVAWWLVAGYTLMNLSKATYFVALPLAILTVLAVPIGTILSGIVGYCLFKEAKSVFGESTSPKPSGSPGYQPSFDFDVEQPSDSQKEPSQE